MLEQPIIFPALSTIHPKLYIVTYSYYIQMLPGLLRDT
ncbi:hypothetical protein RINTHM_250 [Richelia intracellularis HM01]|nr:hypothetical protein RINTHM_250 [Richelia intracellularis HM01]